MQSNQQLAGALVLLWMVFIQALMVQLHVLMVGLRMETTAVVHSEYVFDLIRNFNSGIVTDGLTHSCPESDVIFQGMAKLLGGFHGVDVRDPGVFAIDDLGNCDARVNSWSIREDGVCSNSFISSRNVECWKLGFEMFSHGESSGCYGPLSGNLLYSMAVGFMTCL